MQMVLDNNAERRSIAYLSGHSGCQGGSRDSRAPRTVDSLPGRNGAPTGAPTCTVGSGGSGAIAAPGNRGRCPGKIRISWTRNLEDDLLKIDQRVQREGLTRGTSKRRWDLWKQMHPEPPASQAALDNRFYKVRRVRGLVASSPEEESANGIVQAPGSEPEEASESVAGAVNSNTSDHESATNNSPTISLNEPVP